MSPGFFFFRLAARTPVLFSKHRRRCAPAIPEVSRVSLGAKYNHLNNLIGARYQVLTVGPTGGVDATMRKMYYSTKVNLTGITEAPS